MVDLTVCRVRNEGVDCTLCPPNAILIDCDDLEQTSFFPGMAELTMERLCAAFLGVSHACLRDEILPGFHCGFLPTYPFHTVLGEEGLRLNHTTSSAMLFSQVAGPETITSSCNYLQGGPWVLFRLQDGHVAPIVLEDDKILPIATQIMEQRMAGSY